MAHDIFISYSSEDKHVADAVCAGLEGQGIRCWIAPRDVGPGRDWAATIVDAIQDCRVFVIILSSGSNKSSQVLREVERAVSAGKTVIPFRIEDLIPSKSLGYFLSVSHWLDALTEPLEKHIDVLARNIDNLLHEGSFEEAQQKKVPTGIDAPSLLARSGVQFQSMVHDKNKLHIIITVLMTVLVLGLGWFFFHEQPKTAADHSPAMMNPSMNKRMNNQNLNDWR